MASVTVPNTVEQPVVESAFFNDVVNGLGRPNKSLPCKYFYDERGSQLFDQICDLDEYYLTRTEQAIMDQYADQMAAQLGERAMLIEFGSGSSTKTHVLLENLIQPSAYVPLDISEEHLLKTASALRLKFPHIEVLPVVADFTRDFALPVPQIEASHAAVYFPGSTIGNFETAAAQELLKNIANLLGAEGGLLVGIDLKKDPAIIHAAYNDSRNVTDEFNLNILRRINQELDADFDIDAFEHSAVYDQDEGRVEISLVSRCEQTVNLAEHSFQFIPGEEIFTEYSHKYSVDEFARLATTAGFSLHKHWTDSENLFAVLHLVNESD